MDLPEFPYKMPLLNRLFVDAQYLFGLEKRLKGYDIAHVAETYYGYTIQALNAKKRGDIKYVVSTVWENIPHNNEGIWGRKQFKERAYKEVDLFIAVTKQAKEALVLEGCSSKKIVVIYPGVDLHRFHPVKKSQKSVKHILFVGRLENSKGVWDVLHAFETLYRKNSKLKLRLCGSGSQKDALQKYIDRNLSGCVEVQLAAYELLPSVYNWADVVVVASQETKYWKEQFGMVLIEAMASGVPVIATSSGAIPEVAGDAALLVTGQKGDTIVDAIEELMSNSKKCQELSSKGRERAVKLFDAQKTAIQIGECYNALLKKI